MKKIIAAALALILALGMCACGETLDWDSIHDGIKSTVWYPCSACYCYAG